MNRKSQAMVIIVVVAFALAAAFVFFARHFHASEESTAQAMVRRLGDYPFPSFVTDAMVQQTIRDLGQESRQDLHGALYSARAAFLDENFCQPVFHDRCRDQHGRSFTAFYAVDMNQVDYWYPKANLPLSIAPLVKEFHKAMMDMARQYLADTTRLRRFFEQHELAAVDEIIALTPEQRQNLAKNIRANQTALEAWFNPEVRRLYAEHMVAEAEFVRVDVHDNETARQSSAAYHASEDAYRGLDSLSGNAETVKFAARRSAEGGDALVRTYISICAALCYDLKQKTD